MDGWPGRAFSGDDGERDRERAHCAWHACVPVDTTGRGVLLVRSRLVLLFTAPAGTDAEACKPARHNDRANTSGSGAFDRSGGPSAPPGSVAPRRRPAIRSWLGGGRSRVGTYGRRVLVVPHGPRHGRAHTYGIHSNGAGAAHVRLHDETIAA